MTTMHRLTLDPANLTVRQHLAHPHRIYGALMAATDGAGHAVGGEGRVLYRIERDFDEKAPVRVLIQSDGPIPKPEAFAQYGRYDIASKSMLPVIQFLENDQMVKFSVRLNPVARKSQQLGNRERMTYRLITKNDEVVAWTKRLFASHGFDILECEAARENKVAGKGAHSSVHVFRVEGIAKIVDQRKARIAVKSGVGRAKISGCGMLLLAKA